jgi:hypothetical protein
MKVIIKLILAAVICIFASSQNTANTLGSRAQPMPASYNYPSKTPVIKFDALNYDFGLVKQGKTLEHIYSFTNIGNSILIIQSVQPSCGCTGASIGDKKEFETGETGEIKITFNTEGRSGIITKTITVTTNDPAIPQVTLTFTCEIQ